MDQHSEDSDYLNNISRLITSFQDGILPNEELLVGLKELRKFVLKHCLRNDYLDQLINILETDISSTDNDKFRDLDISTIIALIDCLVPLEPMNDSQIKKIVKWLLFRGSTKIEAGIHAVAWLQMMVKTDLASKECFQRNFYFSFIIFMKHNVDYVGILAYFLADLTEQSLVNPVSIRLVKNLYKSVNSRVRGHLVPFLRSFSQFSEEIKKMKLCRPANGPRIIRQTVIETFGALSYKELPLNDSVSNYSQEKVYEKLPRPVYLSGGGNQLTEIRNVKEVVSKADVLSVPSFKLSSLRCLAGRMYASIADSDFQINLQEQIKMELENWTFPQKKGYFQELLDCLVELQETQCQGIPIISSWLVNFLQLWDSLAYRKQITRLIPWFHFDSVNELLLMLSRLYQVFVTSEIDFCVLIIKTLADLYANLVLVHMNRWENNLFVPFINDTPEWFEYYMECLNLFINTADKFIRAALVLHSFNSFLLLAAIDFYTAVNDVENKIGLKRFTVCSKEVALGALVSPCIMSFRNLTSLFTSYMTVTVPRFRISDDEIEKGFEGNVQQVKDLAHSIHKCTVDKDVKCLRETSFKSILPEGSLQRLFRKIGSSDNAYPWLPSVLTASIALRQESKMDLNEPMDLQEYADVMQIIDAPFDLFHKACTENCGY